MIMHELSDMVIVKVAQKSPNFFLQQKRSKMSDTCQGYSSPAPSPLSLPASVKLPFVAKVMDGGHEEMRAKV